MTDAEFNKYEATRQRIMREVEKVRHPRDPADIRPGSRLTPPGPAFFADMRVEAEERQKQADSPEM